MALYAFDGTNREDEVENERDTNVVRFARAYRGRRFYRPGVGTRHGGVGRLFGGWLGAGLHERVREALDVLKKNLARGDREIDIIGFSRGAAGALHFANQIWEKIGDRQPDAVPIRFIGLFDTVASTGILPGSIDLDLDLELPANVRKCCHAMALDEGRASFHLHRMKPRDRTALPSGAIEEVWFRGCHSDIGGGDRHDKLANIPLCWMLRRAAEAGLRFDELEVKAALDGRDGAAAIIRAAFDKGAKKRKVRAEDTIHCSVRSRDKTKNLWYVNPPDGCTVIGDSGEPRGAFPNESAWPFPIEWPTALAPRTLLQPGEPPRTLQVFADTEWNEFPQLFLEQGARYRFAVVGAAQDWVDGEVTQTNGADGYELAALKPFKHLARVPDAGWFALIGAVDRAELFPIRSGCDYAPRQSGEFACFANDAWFKYGNNRGQLELSVQRVD